jgi:glycosyltransferase involved in cell wall biosynthesis
VASVSKNSLPYDAPGRSILVISPTPSHPQDAGNRARIFNLTSELAHRGHAVSFLFLGFESGDDAAMDAAWSRLFHLPVHLGLRRFSLEALNLLLSLLSPRLALPFRVDDWYPSSLDPWLRRHLRDNRYDAVIVNYVFLSKALESFNSNTLKLIDTHDVFGGRQRQFQSQGRKASWFFTTPEQEAEGLRRADVVMAIQDGEAEYFRRLVPDREVITVGHGVAERPQWSAESPSPRLLFVGSSNKANYYGLREFIESSFESLRNRFPDLELDIVGGVADRFRQAPAGCNLVGRVESLDDYYAKAWFVINTMGFGSGLKIKTVEALGFGKPVVSTPVGVAGLEKGIGWAFEVAESPQEFERKIADLINSPAAREELGEGALRFVRDYNRSAISPLLEVLERGPVVS